MTSGLLDSLFPAYVERVGSPNNGLPASHANEYPVLSTASSGVASRVLPHSSTLPETITNRNGNVNSILLRPDIIKAVQEAAQAYGIERLAAEMDMRPSSLYNALNPWGDRSVAKLGLEAALHVMRVTRDKTAIAMIARELGCTLIPSSKSDKDTVEDEIVDAFSAVAKLAEAIRNRADLAEVTRRSNLAHHEVEQAVDQYRKNIVRA